MYLMPWFPVILHKLFLCDGFGRKSIIGGIIISLTSIFIQQVPIDAKKVVN
jgi:hypothetical protein